MAYDIDQSVYYHVGLSPIAKMLVSSKDGRG